MTFEQFLETYGLEEDFQDSGMTPEEFMKSVFEEENRNYKDYLEKKYITEDLFQEVNINAKNNIQDFQNKER